MIRWLLIAATALLLAGCGDEHRSEGNRTPTPPTPRNAPPMYLYFGVRGRQLEETQDHCKAVMVPSWFGDWGTPTGRQAIADAIIAILTEARTRGFTDAVLTVDFLLWNYNGHGTPAYLNTTELIAFRQRLDILGLTPLVKGLYVMDEPDMKNIPDDIMRMALRDTKAAWPRTQMWCIYGDHGFPGISEVDVVGIDDYPRAEGVLGKLPALRNGQRWVLIPGGSDPWRNDPAPFVTFALAHNEVEAVMPFVYFDRTDEAGVFRKGIGTNGMLPQYKAAALALRGEKSA